MIRIPRSRLHTGQSVSPFKRVHMLKMMSRLRFALDLSAFSTARSIKRPFPLASIEGVGRQKEEEAIGGGEHQSASLVIVWAMSNAPVYTPSLPTDIMRNEGRCSSRSPSPVRLLRGYKFMLHPLERKMREEIVNIVERREPKTQRNSLSNLPH